jgi:hypothetical protein
MKVIDRKEQAMVKWRLFVERFEDGYLSHKTYDYSEIKDLRVYLEVVLADITTDRVTIRKVPEG